MYRSWRGKDRTSLLPDWPCLAVDRYSVFPAIYSGHSVRVVRNDNRGRLPRLSTAFESGDSDHKFASNISPKLTRHSEYLRSVGIPPLLGLAPFYDV